MISFHKAEILADYNRIVQYSQLLEIPTTHSLKSGFCYSEHSAVFWN